MGEFEKMLLSLFAAVGFLVLEKQMRCRLMSFEMSLSTNKSVHLLKQQPTFFCLGRNHLDSLQCFSVFPLGAICEKSSGTKLKDLFWTQRRAVKRFFFSFFFLKVKLSFFPHFLLDCLHLDINLCHFFSEATSQFPTMRQIPRRLISKLNFLLFTVTSVPLTSSKSAGLKLAANPL